MVDIKEEVEKVIESYKNYTPPISGLPTQPFQSVHLFDEPDRPSRDLTGFGGTG